MTSPNVIFVGHEAGEKGGIRVPFTISIRNREQFMAHLMDGNESPPGIVNFPNPHEEEDTFKVSFKQYKKDMRSFVVKITRWNTKKYSLEGIEDDYNEQHTRYVLEKPPNSKSFAKAEIRIKWDGPPYPPDTLKLRVVFTEVARISVVTQLSQHPTDPHSAN